MGEVTFGFRKPTFSEFDNFSPLVPEGSITMASRQYSVSLRTAASRAVRRYQFGWLLRQDESSGGNMLEMSPPADK